MTPILILARLTLNPDSKPLTLARLFPDDLKGGPWVLTLTLAFEPDLRGGPGVLSLPWNPVP